MLTASLRRLLVLTCCAILPIGPARAADPAPSSPPAAPADAQTAPWLRDPALSPDGSRIAFRYAGQIWIAPAAGGDALALTPAGSYAADPVWSPDGATIAFASNRFGPMNVFAVPAGGGAARRLTFTEHDQAPTGFTPDGAAVLFWSPGLGDAVETGPVPNRREDGRQLYRVPVAGGRDTMVLPNAAMEAGWSPAGDRMAYTGPSIEQPFRRRQVSSAARQVWIYDAATGHHRRLTDGTSESRSPVWMPDGGLDYLDEASGSLNVWHRDADLGHPVQVTHFTGEPVRFLSVSRAGDLAFARDGALYRLPHGEAEPRRIDIRLIRTDFPGPQPWRGATLTDFALSPDGRDYAVVSRGQISVASLDGRSVKRLPHTAGEERDPTFSADGRRIAYASERDGHWDLYESAIVDPDEHAFSQATRIAERRLTSGTRDSMMPVYAPDGRHIAYVADRSSVRVLDPASGADIAVLPPGQDFSYDDWPWFLSWSPDSRWLALPVQPSTFVTNIALVPADGSKPAVRPVPSGEDQRAPEWSPDGGMLLWQTDADSLASAFHQRWSADLESAFTSRRAREAFERRMMVPVAGDVPPSAGDRGEAPAAGRGSSDPRDAAALREEAPRGPIPVETDGMADRTRRLSQAPGQIVFDTLMPDGVSVLTVEQSENAKGDGLVLTGTVHDLRRESRRTLFTAVPYQPGPPPRLGRDRRHLYFLSRASADAAGTDGLMEADLQRGTTRLIRITADTTRDEAEARRAAFDQFWTLTQKKFYDPTFKGVDWDAARLRYARFLPSLQGTRDLAELLSEMAGELDASHTGAFVREPVPPAERLASLGLYYDERYPGPGMKVQAVIAGGPFDTGDSPLRPGDVVDAVDGEAVPAEGGLRRILRDRARQVVAVAVHHPDGTAFSEKVLTIPLGREQDLADRAWTERKRDAVAALSCGRLGYVRLAAMDAASYRHAFSEIFGRFGQAQGLVVDIRDNGGGNLHNKLVTLLSGKAYLEVVPPRGGPVQQEPRDRWTRPSAVVMNAASYSDSSLFPLAYRDLHLGPLVGDPVAGTGTSVWWDQSLIVPGLVYGLPELPYHRVDGTPSENYAVEPDIRVPSDPGAWAQGRDPQLEAAVRALVPDAGAPCPVP